MKALTRLAITESERGGPIYWALLCGLIGFAAEVVTRSSPGRVVVATLLSTFGGLAVGANHYAPGEKVWAAFNMIIITVAVGSPHDGSLHRQLKWLFCFNLLLWLALQTRRRLLNRKDRPAAAGSPLWDAELDQ